MVRPSFKVSAGTVVTIQFPDKTRTIDPEDIDFDLVYEDPSIVVVNKPAGLIVHPGVRGESGTLVHGLLHRYPELADNFGVQAEQRPGIVHRLDRGTSGVLVVARTDRARRDLMEQFKNRTVDKRYLAWVFGITPKRGEWTGAIARHQRDRKRFAVVQSGGRSALTEWQRGGQWGKVSSRLEIRLHTGRTHQIRVHAHHAGFPLLGDQTYRRRGKIPSSLSEWGPERMRPALHARRIEFDHPDSGERVEFVAEIPADLAGLDSSYDPDQ